MALRIDKTFRKRLRKKTPLMQAAILRTLAKLDRDPSQHGLNVHRINGTDGIWEAYVDSGNRVTFRREGNTLVFLNHCNHDILRRQQT